MMEKLAQPAEGGGGVHANILTLYLPSTNTKKVVVYAPAERAATLPLILNSTLPPYVVRGLP